MNKSGFRPVGNNVILREDELTSSTGGIILQNQKKPHKVLVAIGETAFRGMETPPKIGQRVIHTEAYPLHAPDIKGGEKYYIAADDKILVVSED